MRKIIIMAAILIAVSTQSVLAQTLTLKVRGIEKNKGMLFIAFYDSENNFMKKPQYTMQTESTDSVITLPCKGLPKGEYAITMFQDANCNRRLDTDDIGMPVEKYGFSNNAKPVFGPPTFSKCKFKFKEDTTIEIKLRP